MLSGQHCAGREYLDLLTGKQQFVAFWRTLPWDHAPGALLVREAGGVVRRFDGEPYRPADEGNGLLVGDLRRHLADGRGRARPQRLTALYEPVSSSGAGRRVR